MVAAADAAGDESGYYWATEGGAKRLMYQGKRVAVVSDIDDTLVDGVHYTANILGRNGEWTNKSFADFIMSEGCTALPGAVDFINHCVESGVEVYYVTNRYDQGYKTSQAQYGGETGYRDSKGNVIGSSVYEEVGKTFYDISMESMEALGLLTHPEGQPYMEYVAGLRHNSVAVKVKLADLRHNSDFTRLSAVTAGQRARLEQKYAPAFALLEGKAGTP